MDDFTVLVAGDTFDSGLQSRSKVPPGSAGMHFLEHLTSMAGSSARLFSLKAQSEAPIPHPAKGLSAYICLSSAP